MSVIASETTHEIWSRLEGRVINGPFTLRRCLGTSDHSGVFLTEFAKRGLAEVALKLIPVAGIIPDSYVARWRAAGGLGHPNLLRLLEAGRCQLDGLHYLYLVMEYSDQNLAQLLERRALTEDEVREMLPPVLSALAFLHERNFVHGKLTPANVLVVGDQLKLASDTIRAAGDVSERVGVMSAHEPPEARDGVYAPAGDVWALGVTLCEALSRQQPSGLHDAGGGFSLPPELSPAFLELVARCLSEAPAARPSVANIEAWLRGAELPPMPVVAAETVIAQRVVAASAPPPSAVMPAAPEPAPTEVELRAAPATAPTAAVASRAAPVAAAPVAASPVETTSRAAPSVASPVEVASPAAPVAAPPTEVVWEMAPNIVASPAEVASRPAPVAAGAPRTYTPYQLPVSHRTAVLILAAVGAVVLGWAGLRAIKSKPVSTAPVEAAAAPATSAPSSSSPTSSTSPPTATPGATSAPAGRQTPPSRATTVKPASTADALSPSQVHEVIPDVPRSASRTIRGHIKVSIRVIIDKDGTVFAALTEVRGPSRYFERLALDAAKKWTFAPTESDAQRLMLLRFDFSRQGTTARAVPLQ